MQTALKAVIFDMDGVLIESEHLWRRAMIRGFSETGIDLTEDDCRKTMGLRITEVIALWIAHSGIQGISPKNLENRIMELLLQMINENGVFIQGIPALLSFCREKKLKMGLATSSSHVLMDAVLKKLDLTNALDAAVSAEHLPYGKPHPEVFLRCAAELGVTPRECLVIEDSLNGVIAAKAAQMQVIAVPDDEHVGNKKFAVADFECVNMLSALEVCKTIF